MAKIILAFINLAVVLLCACGAWISCQAVAEDVLPDLSFWSGDLTEAFVRLIAPQVAITFIWLALAGYFTDLVNDLLIGSSRIDLR